MSGLSMPSPKALVATITRRPPAMKASCTAARSAAGSLPWYRPTDSSAACSASYTACAALMVAV